MKLLKLPCLRWRRSRSRSKACGDTACRSGGRQQELGAVAAGSRSSSSSPLEVQTHHRHGRRSSYSRTSLPSEAAACLRAASLRLASWPPDPARPGSRPPDPTSPTPDWVIRRRLGPKRSNILVEGNAVIRGEVEGSTAMRGKLKQSAGVARGEGVGDVGIWSASTCSTNSSRSIYFSHPRSHAHNPETLVVAGWFGRRRSLPGPPLAGVALPRTSPSAAAASTRSSAAISSHVAPTSAGAASACSSWRGGRSNGVVLLRLWIMGTSSNASSTSSMSSLCTASADEWLLRAVNVCWDWLHTRCLCYFPNAQVKCYYEENSWPSLENHDLLFHHDMLLTHDLLCLLVHFNTREKIQ
jgi:hypothetical protein